MKHLDLKQMGVQELNAVEIKETDGGFLLALAVGYLLLAGDAVLDDPQGFVDGVVDCFT